MENSGTEATYQLSGHDAIEPPLAHNKFNDQPLASASNSHPSTDCYHSNAASNFRTCNDTPTRHDMHSSNHIRHDSHHNFSVHAQNSQPRSSSSLEHYHREVSPSPSALSNTATTYHHQHNISPVELHSLPKSIPQNPEAALSITHRTTLAHWSCLEEKFTAPCLKCTEDGNTNSAPSHSILKCGIVPVCQRAKLCKGRGVLHVEMLGMLGDKHDAPVFAALHAIKRILPDAGREDWI